LAVSAVGRTIALCGTPFTIIGVTPPEFFGLEVGTAPDFFVPVMMQPAVMPASENLLENPINISTWLRTFGRLRPGVRAERAVAELEALHHQDKSLDKSGQPLWSSEKLVLTPAGTGLSDLRRQFSQPLFILMTVVVVVLLIACANVANLLLARGAARQTEFAMRVALGAGRWRLMRQLLAESVLLAILGGIVGILLAYWGTQFLVAFMSAGRTPIVMDLRPDLRILVFTSGVSVLTGILFGFAPALRASRVDLTPALKGQSSRISSGRPGLGPGKILVVSQVALSLVLCIGACLFVRSLQKLNGQDGGFRRESVLVVRVEPKGSDQRGVPGTSPRLDRTYRELLQRVESVPGVRSASLAHFTPTSRVGFSSPVRLVSGEEVGVPRLMVYPNYFATMGIPIVAGRDFNAGDLDENSALVAVVNEAFVHQVFKGENPVGKQYFTRPPRRRESLPCEIIGVVRDSRYASLRGETPPVIYQPFLQTNTGRGQMVLHVRIAGSSGLILPRVREEVLKVDKDMPMFDVRTLADEMNAALIQERLIATLSSFFGALALVLACVGLYGLMAFAAVRRTAEMGIRIALGALRRDVVWLVLREALLLITIGTAMGIPLALVIARLASSQISGLLFGLTATDPATIAMATLVLVLVAAIAGYLPARRASRVDPIVALRSE
jgi:predicted permease